MVDENGQFKGIISQFDILGLLEPYMNTGAHELASKVVGFIAGFSHFKASL